MSRGYINVTAVGTLGRDPEVRSTGSGTKVATFSIAVDQGYGDKSKTEWVNILCFNKLAELAEKYLKKGKSIALSGTLQTSSWDDRETGQKRYKTEVLARDITFMDSGGSRSDQGQERSRATQATRQSTSPSPRVSSFSSPANDDPDPFGSSPEDSDIPF